VGKKKEKKKRSICPITRSFPQTPLSATPDGMEIQWAGGKSAILI